MNKPNVIFMGTPDFAVESLAKIYEAGHDVMVVVYCLNGDSSQYNMVDEFLEELGCPTPR